MTVSTLGATNLPTLDAIVEEIARIDASVDQHRSINDSVERQLFGFSCEGEARKSATLSIAMRDELIEEMLLRRTLLLSSLPN